MTKESILKKIDKNQKIKAKKFSKLLNQKKNYTIIFDEKKDRINLLQDNKKILTCSYYFYGIIQLNNLWIWGTSIPGVSNEIKENIKKIKKNSKMFKNSNNKRSMFYYQFLTQDVLAITEDIQVYWINSLLLYLDKSIFYLNPTNEKNNLQFINIKKIYEKYI